MNDAPCTSAIAPGCLFRPPPGPSRQGTCRRERGTCSCWKMHYWVRSLEQDTEYGVLVRTNTKYCRAKTACSWVPRSLLPQPDVGSKREGATFNLLETPSCCDCTGDTIHASVVLPRSFPVARSPAKSEAWPPSPSSAPRSSTFFVSGELYGLRRRVISYSVRSTRAPSSARSSRLPCKFHFFSFLFVRRTSLVDKSAVPRRSLSLPVAPSLRHFPRFGSFPPFVFLFRSFFLRECVSVSVCFSSCPPFPFSRSASFAASPFSSLPFLFSPFLSNPPRPPRSAPPIPRPPPHRHTHSRRPAKPTGSCRSTPWDAEARLWLLCR